MAKNLLRLIVILIDTGLIIIIINCFQTISSYKVIYKIYKYKLESFGRPALSQHGPFSGVSLSGEQEK